LLFNKITYYICYVDNIFKYNNIFLSQYFLVDNEPLQISSNLSDLDLPSALLDNMGLDNVFVINLARRTERRNRMHYCLNELGLNATFIEATDGRLVI